MSAAANPIVSGLLSDAFRADPFPLFAMLREQQPLVRTPFGPWIVTRYDDVARLLRDVRCGFRRSDGTPYVIPDVPQESPFDPNDFLLLQDGAPHARLRKILAKAFTPRTIERLRPEVQEICDACVDEALARGSLDVAADVARVVPSTMICKMMGVPLADRAQFTEWTASATHTLAAQFEPADAIARAEPALAKLVEYFLALIEERRRRLGDDLLSEMIRAEEDGERLSSAELLVQCVGILAAGFETTIGLIGLGMRQLLLHPDQLALLREEPEWIGSAIEECLRFDPPIVATLRLLHEETEWHGERLPVDTPILAMIGAANRDPRAFPEPDRFDVRRRGAPHWSFGGGAHFCLGAHLARLEAQLAIGTLVRRLDGLELEQGTLEWSASLFRVPARLGVRFRGARA